jgi:hypothetical protein
MSLIGRDPASQKSGVAARRAVAHSAEDAVETAVKMEYAAISAIAPAIGDQMASDRDSVRGDPSDGAIASSAAFAVLPNAM